MNKTLLYILLLVGTANILSAQAPRSYPSSEILLQLKKLNTLGSVLYIAAHPDDENTRLLAYLANEKCLRTGYLSLTRGDGGQNLIGPEQGIELGMIRTQELLAARRIDGAEQFFTRAYDFGFSKNPEETFTKWNRDSILADVVWTIRTFRPDIIITRFSTDGSGGHGHHTASAILAEEAFDAAADPKRFPEQLRYVQVWQAKRLFYNSAARFFNPNADMSRLLKVDVGGYNILLGKSYGELAAESRSNHKSQGFGAAKQRGEMLEYFKPLKGDTGNLSSIFDGIDFSWRRVKGGEKIAKAIDDIIKTYDFNKPENSITKLVDLYKLEFFHLMYGVNPGLSHAFNDANFMEKVSAIIANASGLFMDVTANTSNMGTGDSIEFTVNITNRSGYIARITSFTIPFQLAYFKGVESLSNNYLSMPDSILPNQSITRKIKLKSSEREGPVSELYWLSEGITNNMFNFDPKRNRIYSSSNPAGLNANFDVSFVVKNKHQMQVPFSIPIQYRWVDPEKGELYRPLVITPPVMISFQQKSLVFSDMHQKEIKVLLKAGKDHVTGTIKFEVPAGWVLVTPETGTHETTFTLQKKNDEQTLLFYLYPLENAGEQTIRVSAIVDDVAYSKGIREIKYDHIPVQTWFPQAEAKLVKVDVKRKLKTIGYIEGAGDEVPNALEQIGYQVVKITDDQLQNGDLTIYPAIVVGVRAFNTNEKLQQHKNRVFEYVKNGGNLVVQYNTNSFAGPLKEQISPIPFKLTRERVTIEEAPVSFALPEHPVLNIPNKISSKDFEGWIQERGIYFAGDMDSNFLCPLLMNDPGEKPNKGSLIIAKYGKGNYIYTGLAFFRELPAGVPGAYRLFVNLIEAGK